MSNNRQQQVESFLNGLTKKEIDDYIGKNKLNVNTISKLKRVRDDLPGTHLLKLTNQCSSEFYKEQEKYLNSLYKIGQAQLVALLLNEFYDADFKVSDVKSFFKIWIDGDKELKDYVYEIMKDY